MKCENCTDEHDGTFASGRFCGIRCSRAFSTKQKRKSINRKISKALTGRISGSNEWSADAINAFRERHHHRKQKRIFELSWEEVPKNHYRKRLLFEQKSSCAICKSLPTWCDQPLTFQMDHIDGNRSNDSRENLRLICPNCHSQTSTFGHRNVSEDGKKRRRAGAIKARMVNRTGLEPVSTD